MLIGGLYSSLKAIVFGAIMLIVMILVWAVVSVEMLHPIASVIDFPGTCERCSRGFADIFSASVTIFQQIVAGDSWGAISIPLVDARQHFQPGLAVFGRPAGYHSRFGGSLPL